MSFSGAHRRLHGRSAQPHAERDLLFVCLSKREFSQAQLTALLPNHRQKTPQREECGVSQTGFLGNVEFQGKTPTFLSPKANSLAPKRNADVSFGKSDRPALQTPKTTYATHLV
jgi:hypothetical protein